MSRSEWLGAIGARTIPMLCGHGVGCWWHQQEPLIAAGAAHRLEAGMVLALEPYLDHWHIQDMVLVTESPHCSPPASRPMPHSVEPLS
jgi:Xaa-Pro aminopeptidase